MLEKFSFSKFFSGFNIFSPVKLVKLFMNLLPIIIIGFILWSAFLKPKLDQQQKQIIDLRGASNFTLEAGQTQPIPKIPKRFGWISLTGEQVYSEGELGEKGTLFGIEIGKDFY